MVPKTSLPKAYKPEYITILYLSPQGNKPCPEHTLKTYFPPAGTYTVFPHTLGTKCTLKTNKTPELEGRTMPYTLLREHYPGTIH